MSLVKPFVNFVEKINSLNLINLNLKNTNNEWKWDFKGYIWFRSKSSSPTWSWTFRKRIWRMFVLWVTEILISNRKTETNAINLWWYKLDIGYRIDLLVERNVVFEIKSVESLNEIHIAQVLTYLKLSNCKSGLLINFNSVLFKNGVKRLINGTI